MMHFSFDSYKALIRLLLTQGYHFCSYHDFTDNASVIMRHDIDYSIDKALDFAYIEKDIGISSTYFVLFTSDFYNVLSRRNVEKLKILENLGHEIGLHFDETVYNSLDRSGMVKAIQRESFMLSDSIGSKVTCVSMHRPSHWVLDADLIIPGMVNSYGKVFFQDFKYVSDSSMHWRENVLKYINEKTYSKLHILTHAFWYNEEEISMKNIFDKFLSSARRDRYAYLQDNFTDLSAIIKE